MGGSGFGGFFGDSVQHDRFAVCWRGVGDVIDHGSRQRRVIGCRHQHGVQVQLNGVSRRCFAGCFGHGRRAGRGGLALAVGGKVKSQRGWRGGCVLRRRHGVRRPVSVQGAGLQQRIQFLLQLGVHCRWACRVLCRLCCRRLFRRCVLGGRFGGQLGNQRFFKGEIQLGVQINLGQVRGWVFRAERRGQHGFGVDLAIVFGAGQQRIDKFIQFRCRRRCRCGRMGGAFRAVFAQQFRRQAFQRGVWRGLGDRQGAVGVIAGHQQHRRGVHLAVAFGAGQQLAHKGIQFRRLGRGRHGFWFGGGGVQRGELSGQLFGVERSVRFSCGRGAQRLQFVKQRRSVGGRVNGGQHRLGVDLAVVLGAGQQFADKGVQLGRVKRRSGGRRRRGCGGVKRGELGGQLFGVQRGVGVCGRRGSQRIQVKFERQRVDCGCRVVFCLGFDGGQHRFGVDLAVMFGAGQQFADKGIQFGWRQRRHGGRLRCGGRAIQRGELGGQLFGVQRIGGVEGGAGGKHRRQRRQRLGRRVWAARCVDVSLGWAVRRQAGCGRWLAGDLGRRLAGGG